MRTKVKQSHNVLSSKKFFSPTMERSALRGVRYIGPNIEKAAIEKTIEEIPWEEFYYKRHYNFRILASNRDHCHGLLNQPAVDCSHVVTLGAPTTQN